MKVLFIGGTGIISSACSKLAVEQGFDLFLFNRGKTARPIPEEAHMLEGDIRDKSSTVKAIKDMSFDVVVNWIAFIPEHIESDLEIFTGRTQQYIFISSASAYQTPPLTLPITESTPLENPYWEYSRNKIACEERLMQAYHQDQFPVTIVRPSHTYDCRSLPLQGRYTVVDRMRKGKKIIVHGDGTSLWVLTHHLDFARGFTGLLGNQNALGHAFHITSDEVLTWNRIIELVAEAAGAEAHIVHIPSEYIAAFDPEWGASLLGDKAHSMVFDNAKIKNLVPDYEAIIPFHRGADEMIAWHDADPSRQRVDETLDRLMDIIIKTYEASWPNNSSLDTI